MPIQTEDHVSEDGHLHPATVLLPLPPNIPQAITNRTFPAQDLNDAPSELIKAVDELLENLSTKFSKVSTEVFAKSGSLREVHRLEVLGGL